MPSLERCKVVHEYAEEQKNGHLIYVRCACFVDAKAMCELFTICIGLMRHFEFDKKNILTGKYHMTHLVQIEQSLFVKLQRDGQ